jgi:myo-inositol catabolism protein IolC
MTSLGYDRPLYLLPFDHRASFQTKLFGWDGPLNSDQMTRVVAAKQIIYDGFQLAFADGIDPANSGILVDEHFGASILSDATRQGYITCMSTEKSGQHEFDFEYGEAFADHIEAFRPTFCKVLVRYNPQDDRALNDRQIARLKRLSDYLSLDQTRSSRFMFELLVPPENSQLEKVHGNLQTYDLEIRPELTIQTIHELQDAGIEPDIWKVEGLDRQTDCRAVVSAVRRGGRDRVSCIVLGRGENDVKVKYWLSTAASVPGFVGFAVGRTTFWQPLIDYLRQSTTREAAARRIADSFRTWVDLFEHGSGVAQLESVYDVST